MAQWGAGLPLRLPGTRSRGRARLVALVGAGAVVAAAALGAPGAGAASQDGFGPGRPAQVWPLGDSITYGQTLVGAPTPGGYRGDLAQQLAGDGVPFRYVGTSDANAPLDSDPAQFHHDGHPGYRIDQVTAALAGPDGDPGAGGGYWMAGTGTRAGVSPDLVIIHLGTNDIAQAFDPGRSYPGGYQSSDPGQRARFVSDLVGRLQHLLGAVLRADPRARFALCTIAPMGETGEDPTVAAYDQAIRQRVVPLDRWLGVRITLADVEASFLDYQGGYHALLGPDGVHPNPMGYQVMAQAIAPAVEAALRLR